MEATGVAQLAVGMRSQVPVLVKPKSICDSAAESQ